MTENWVIDASPLILLGKAGQLEWLPQMGRIVVPASVAAEVASGSPADPARQWLETAQGAASIVSDLAFGGDLLTWDLGAGETAVIAMARANPPMHDATAIHGHDIIDLVAAYPDGIRLSQLMEIVGEHFGKSVIFHTCSAAGMDLDELLHFLEARDKVRIKSGVVYPGGVPACEH